MSIVEVQHKLALAQQNLHHYESLSRLPSLSARAALAAHNQARSLRAAVSLYQKALDYELAKAKPAS